MNLNKIQQIQVEGLAIHVLSYDCPNGACERLPVGTRFDVVYSPSPYQTRPRWHTARFQVVLSPEPYGQHKGDVGRRYRQVQARDLTGTEVAAVEAMLLLKQGAA